MPHLLEVLANLSDKGVSLRILAMGIDTATPTGKLMLTILGGIAEFEREIMLERQREGIAKAKAAGKYKGRKPTALAKSDEVMSLVASGLGPSKIASEVGISRASVYRITKQQKSLVSENEGSSISKFAWEKGDLREVQS